MRRHLSSGRLETILAFTRSSPLPASTPTSTNSSKCTGWGPNGFRWRMGLSRKFVGEISHFFGTLESFSYGFSFLCLVSKCFSLGPEAKNFTTVDPSQAATSHSDFTHWYIFISHLAPLFAIFVPKLLLTPSFAHAPHIDLGAFVLVKASAPPIFLDLVVGPSKISHCVNAMTF